MHPNLPKVIHRKWLEGNPTRPRQQPETIKTIVPYGLTLHLLNGNKVTLYYLYLVKSEFILSGGPLNALVLRFTSDKVTLQGYLLEKLHAEFASKKLSDIYVSNPRYVIPEIVDQPVVIEALIEERKY